METGFIATEQKLTQKILAIGHNPIRAGNISKTNGNLLEEENIGYKAVGDNLKIK
jgi:hypothetical protein